MWVASGRRCSGWCLRPLHRTNDLLQPCTVVARRHWLHSAELALLDTAANFRVAAGSVVDARNGHVHPPGGDLEAGINECIALASESQPVFPGPRLR